MVIIAKHENKDNLIYKQSLAGSLSSLFSKAPLENSVVCFCFFFFYCLLGFGGGFLLFVLGFFFCMGIEAGNTCVVFSPTLPLLS